MGEVKAMLTQIIVVLVCASGAFLLLGQAAKNSNSQPAVVPLNGSIGYYSETMMNMSKTFVNATEASSTTPATGDPLQVGWAMLSAAGRAVTIFFMGLGTMLDMIATSALTLIGFGLPPFFIDFATLFVVLVFGMAIFSIIYKWWL